MDISVVIVSYNASSYLKDCLDSLFQFTKNVDFEVIIVDNASTDDAVKVAKSFGNKIKLIENKENKGFGTGVNIGAKVAKGDYLLILNPDIRLLENSLEKLIIWMKAHKDIAVSTCQFLDSEQKPLPNGGFFPTLSKVAAWSFFIDDILKIPSYHPHPGPLYEKVFYPDWVTGSFMFIRKEAWDQSGGFDDRIFMYGEEVELCYRIKKAGWKIAYLPLTKVIHHERKSASEALPRGAILGEFHGLKYFYGKHCPEWQQVAVGTLLDIAAFNRIILWLLRRNLPMVRLYLEALML